MEILLMGLGFLALSVLNLAAILLFKRGKDQQDKMMDVVSQLVLLVPAVASASKQLDEFEDFYQNTIEDVDSVLEMLSKLMKRKIISDDPDIQNFYKVMGIAHDTLAGYRNAKGRGKEEGS